MWTKYIYVCNNCDALITVTACVSPEIDPACICQASSHVTLISWEDATVPDNDVTSITAVQVVKIDSNPYN
jgi:hypothetical protein